MFSLMGFPGAGRKMIWSRVPCRDLLAVGTGSDISGLQCNRVFPFTKAQAEVLSRAAALIRARRQVWTNAVLKERKKQLRCYICGGRLPSFLFKNV